MKAATVFGAGLLVLLAAPAFGQSRYCERPRKPVISIYLPKEDLLPVVTEVEDYIGRMEDYLECLQAEQDDALLEAKQVAQDLALIEGSAEAAAPEISTPDEVQAPPAPP